jgi:hypothetical protein
MGDMTRIFLAAIGVCGLLAGSARATIVADNTGEPDHAAVHSANGSWAAASFTTDGTAYELTRITVQATFANNVTFSLYDDNGGVPGSPIAALAGPTSFGFPEALRVYTPTAVVLLNPLTTYYVVADAGMGNLDWRLSTSTAETGPGSIGDRRFFSLNSGASWTEFSSLAVKFRVEGVMAVPEASAALCVGLAGVGLLWVRRRGRAVLRAT